jgi:hypothetical protein
VVLVEQTILVAGLALVVMVVQEAPLVPLAFPSMALV